MEIIRILNIEKHYDRRERRFTSLAFKNSSGTNPGISVVSRECIQETSNIVCSHISRFYSAVAGEPVIFWCFIEDILPEGYRLEQENSSTGDSCHYNIMGLTDAIAKRFFKPFGESM